MTESVKTWHNCARLNLQYKPLITMGKILAYFNTKNCTIFKHVFLSEERFSDIMQLNSPMQEKFENLCFVAID